MRRPLRFVAVLAAALAAVASAPEAARATGTWNGQNTLHVPASWCVVRGSQAEAAPNVAGDTATDDVIWRRHERPTDFIYVNQTGITFRSAINNAWTTLDFPRIDDPDTTLGVQGDMRGENVNTAGVEFNALINNCDTEYNNIGRAGIGITMVNANMFHNAAGNYIGIVGWGGCTRVGTTCSAPFDGRVVVVDNHYLHPSVPVRTWPDGGGPFPVTDSLDVDTGHEAGHSLGLPHRVDPTALMNATLTDNDGNGDIDNIGLDATEVGILRGNALNVPGLEQDPPGVIVPASVVAHRIPDRVREDKRVPAYLDVASVRVGFDEPKKEVTVVTQLFGLVPKNAKAPTYWFLIDTDNERTGADAEVLRKLGLAYTAFTGADLVGRATVRGGRVTGELWGVREGRAVPLTGGFRYELQTLVMYPLYVTKPKERMLDAVPVHHLIGLRLTNDLVRLGMGGSLRLQATAGEGRRAVADTLGEGGRFVLERPSFPHCFPQDDARPGGQVKVKLEGLRPNAVIHGLFGPRLIFRGETDANGGGTITLDIPKDATPGLHLVTVGIDKTALTADCVVNVARERQ